MTNITLLKMDSPVGELTVCATESAVVAVAFANEESQRRMKRYIERYCNPKVTEGGAVLCEQAKLQLCEYFNNARRGFDFPIEYMGSSFQLKVWQALSRVSYGELLSYAQLAAAAGRPQAPRAAGAACGANPLAIVLPCHRIVGSDSSLTKFGGGLEAKRWLLEHEGHCVDERYRLHYEA